MKKTVVPSIILLGVFFLAGCSTLHPVVYSPPQFSAPKNTAPRRIPAVVQTIWIAPFIDSAGNYHSESFEYCVVRKAHWGTLPPSMRTSFPKGKNNLFLDKNSRLPDAHPPKMNQNPRTKVPHKKVGMYHHKTEGTRHASI